MKRYFFSALAAVTAILGSSIAYAASPVQLSSDVFVEKQIKKADGKAATVLQKPTLVTPGDNLVFIINYKNVGTAPATNFSVTNPLPKAVAFSGSADGLELVSVDGGKSWGFLPALRIPGTDGKLRPAQMADVTHLKWNLNQTLAAGAGGKLMFRGVVK